MIVELGSREDEPINLNFFIDDPSSQITQLVGQIQISSHDPTFLSDG